VNYTLEKECRHCHEPVPPREKEKVRDRAVRWASAYRKTCAKGHEYPMKLDGCPQCGDDPQLYMAQVAKLSGSDSGWHSYTSRDWFRK
jgi:rRNA maturation protein Nop10